MMTMTVMRGKTATFPFLNRLFGGERSKNEDQEGGAGSETKAHAPKRLVRKSSWKITVSI